VELQADYVPGDIGWEFWCCEGEALPARTCALLRSVDAALFGAVTSKPAKQAQAELRPGLQGRGLAYRSPIVRLRQLFDLYLCQRPCKAYPGNRLNHAEGIDIVVFRENTEDLYAGVEFAPVPHALARVLEELSPAFGPFAALQPEDYALSCKIVTRRASERIARAAYEYALRNDRRKVTIVHKANVVRAADGLFLDAAQRVAADFPQLAVADANVDALGMWLLKNPRDYDVLLAPNLYGDIVSDLCAQMVGGLGFACSANIGDALAVFEPTHGSAPRHAGKNRANPIAAILAAKMMLDWLGEADKALRIEQAVAAVIGAGRVRTHDMGGSVGTFEMARAVADEVRQPARVATAV
jgi:3-isopropylmalate dehydrogenase